jgi:hypothetical protein
MAPRRHGQLGIVERLATRAEVIRAGVLWLGTLGCIVIATPGARYGYCADQASRLTY